MNSEVPDEYLHIRIEEYSDVVKEPDLTPLELDLYAATSILDQSQYLSEAYSPSMVSPSPSVASMSSNSAAGHDMLHVGPYSYDPFSSSAESLASYVSIDPSRLSFSPGPRAGSSDLGEPQDEGMSFGELQAQPATFDYGYVSIQADGDEPMPIPVGLPSSFSQPEQKHFLAVNPQLKQQRGFSSSDDLTTQDMTSLMAAAGEMPGTGDGSKLSVKDKFMRYLSAANRKFRPRVQKKGGASAEASKSRRLCDPKWVCIVAGCDQDFTRKNGLMNHYRAHLQISHLACRKCGGLFRNSLRRHEKTCKGDKQMS